jgi:FAD/FMN-containing dehydrogenase
MSTVITGVQLDEAAVEQLRRVMRGPALLPDAEGYHEARKIWNGMIDRCPAIITRCRDTADVVAAVNFGRDHGLEIAVRGGGHSLPGQSVCEGGLMIDLSLLNGVHVDAKAKTVQVGGGCLLGDVDHATAAYGLVSVGGTVSHTGVGGLALGGGFGWLARKYGLVVDNMLAVEIVTADGRILNASADENPDLFWAVRGGGGNFGVVTSFVFRLHEMNPILVGGLALFPADRAREVLHALREIMSSAPDDLTLAAVWMFAPPAPFVPPDMVGAPMVAIAGAYAGSIEDGMRAVEPVKALGPAVDLLGPMPYLALQTMIDEGNPHFIQYYNKAHYLGTLTDEIVDTYIEQSRDMTSPMSQALLFPFGGAVSRNRDNAMGYRDTEWAYILISAWTDPSESDRHIGWTRRAYNALEPFASGGVYVNDLNDEGPNQVTKAYEPAAYERLRDVKTKYDPANLFHMNQNILPRG